VLHDNFSRRSGERCRQPASPKYEHAFKKPFNFARREAAFSARCCDYDGPAKLGPSCAAAPSDAYIYGRPGRSASTPRPDESTIELFLVRVLASPAGPPKNPATCPFWETLRHPREPWGQRRAGPAPQGRRQTDDISQLSPSWRMRADLRDISRACGLSEKSRGDASSGGGGRDAEFSYAYLNRSSGREQHVQARQPSARKRAAFRAILGAPMKLAVGHVLRTSFAAEFPARLSSSARPTPNSTIAAASWRPFFSAPRIWPALRDRRNVAPVVCSSPKRHCPRLAVL